MTNELRGGLSVAATLGLAALAVPRVILHDLHLISQSGPETWVLALGPVVAWIVAAVLSRTPRPFLTVLLIGVSFGVMLVVTHQLLWDVAFQGTPPTLGTGPAAAIIPRVAAVFSGLATGTAMGAIAGLIATLVSRAGRGRGRPDGHRG